MSKVTLSNVTSFQNDSSAVATVNADLATITTAFDNTLSRDGSSPNQMGASLDMNSNSIINLPTPVSGQSPLRLQDYNTLISGGTIFVSNTVGIEYIIEGGGAVVSTGLHPYVQIPFSATIQSVTLLADRLGSVVVDIWKVPFASFNPPTAPTVTNTITGSSIPTISSGVSYTDSTLSGWSLNINAGDVLAFNVNSVTNIQRLTVVLKVLKTS